MVAAGLTPGQSWKKEVKSLINYLDL